jgi:hypothetical protein
MDRIERVICAGRRGCNTLLTLSELSFTVREVFFSRRSVSVQPGDERRQELAQHRRPFGVLGAAGGMAEIAVELAPRPRPRSTP